MENIGSVTQVVTSDVAQQASEANKKQLEKQPTEKSSDVFLATLNSQDDNRGTLVINRATPLFVLLIARLNGTGGNGNNHENTSSPSGVASVRSVPIFNVTVPTLGFAGNGDNTNASSTITPSVNSSSVRNTPIFGNVTVPSLGTVGSGTSQGTGADNSTTIGSPLVSISPVATQVGTGFQSLLAGNTSTDNNSSGSSHWRRGSSSSSSSGFNINSLFGR